MDRSNVIYLVEKTYATDAIKQRVPIESLRKVFCNIASVGQSEFFAAGQAGLKPEYQITMFGPDYHGESEIELSGTRYSIYRTDRRQDDNIELYVQKRAGA